MTARGPRRGGPGRRRARPERVDPLLVTGAGLPYAVDVVEGAARFEEIEHTADVALRVWGSSLAELFANAGEGMFSLIGRAVFAVSELTERELCVEGDQAAELLHGWLSALLAEFNRDGFFAIGFDVRPTAGGCTGRVTGGRFDPARHEFFTEIKGVTFHGLRVRPDAQGWRAEVVFDV